MIYWMWITLSDRYFIHVWTGNTRIAHRRVKLNRNKKDFFSIWFPVTHSVLIKMVLQIYVS